MSIESLDALTFNAPPVFVTASGSLGSVFNTLAASLSSSAATDAEGNTITYSIVSGSLPGSGLTLSSSTGLITGTLSGSPSLGNYPFVVRAATTEGTVERQFSIQVVSSPFISATGGTVTTTGNYKIHTFTGPGSFVVSSAGTPAGSDTVDYLVVAGGGAGGQNNGGAGGAGGFREAKSPLNASPHTASPLATPTGITLTAQTYPITVGGGGAAQSGDGGPSVFSTITSTGGGGGGRDLTSGNTGGSGGGAGHDNNATFPGAAGNTPPVSPPQGNPGGGITGGASWGGGGGGGALTAGGLGNPSPAGPGGEGATTSISNSPTTYAGGGGGSTEGGTAGSGGPGGGGAGSSGTATPGSTNLGGGGGGSNGGNGGDGGSGIVIIRYKFQ